MSVDPLTLLPTGGAVEGFSPDQCAPFWDHELLAPGFPRDTGRTRLLGVSNVSWRHLAQMALGGAETPAFVQNRCFASRGWDRDVRAFCQERGIVYQGFSLLTANREVLHDDLIAGICARLEATPAQVVFAFARAVGMLPLTGTSDAEHMRQDLASLTLQLSPDEVRAIESLAG